MYRGAQPATAEDWTQLENLGIGNIIKLNEIAEALDVPIGRCIVHCEPISLTQQLLPIPVDISRTVTLAQQLFAQGIAFFWHCEHGQDRTGLLGAILRVLLDDWSTDAAEHEMLAYGFHHELLGLWLSWEKFKYERTSPSRG